MSENLPEVVDTQILPLVRSIYDSLETDESLEDNGVEFDFGLGVGHWTIAYSGNQAFQSAFSEAMKPYSQLNEQDYKDPAIDRVVRNVMIDCYANHCVKNFRECIGRDGIEIPFSHKMAAELMKGLQLKHLFRLVREASTNFANYRIVYVDDTAKK